MSTEAMRLSRPLALFMRAHCESRTDPDVKMPQRETPEQGVLHLLSIGQESGCARTVCVRCARPLHPVAVRHQAQGVLLRPLRGSAAVGVPLTPHRRAPASGVPRVPCANCAGVHMSARPGSPPVGTGIRSVRSHRPAVVISRASPRGGRSCGAATSVPADPRPAAHSDKLPRWGEPLLRCIADATCT